MNIREFVWKSLKSIEIKLSKSTWIYNLGENIWDKHKGALSGLRQFLATENPLRMMGNVFFHLKSSFRSKDIKFFV